MLTLREWREYRGYTQKEVAEEIGSSISSISKMENNKDFFYKTRYEVISKLYELLEIAESDIEWI